MPVRLVPAGYPGSMLRVDLHVGRPAYGAAVLDSGRHDTPQNGVEILPRHSKAEVMHGEGLVRILRRSAARPIAWAAWRPRCLVTWPGPLARRLL